MKRISLFVVLIMAFMTQMSCKKKQCYICETINEHKNLLASGKYETTTDKSSTSKCDITKEEKDKIEKDGYKYYEHVDSYGRIAIIKTTTVTCK